MTELNLKLPQPSFDKLLINDPKKNPILSLYLEHGNGKFKFIRTKWFEINDEFTDAECTMILELGEHRIKIKHLNS